jgi:tRNA U34 2-thiouridine synthase MnmA/TrmU
MDQGIKVLALISGGLDSTLAVKVLLEQGIQVEAVNFTTPFCNCDKCAVESLVETLGIKVHSEFLGQEYLDLVVNPPHGYGSQMNPCIDCRILMFQKAKELAHVIEAESIVTGEVLNQRPFSQRKHIMLLIDREAGLENKVLRPLSARLLPETEVEQRGYVDREKLYAIQGRRRIPQMTLAEELKITDYPCSSGGCLLTDPHFTNRLKEFLKYNKTLTVDDISLLKLGRHFRLEDCKIIVGRNETENERLLTIAQRTRRPYLEVVDYMGPITLINGTLNEKVILKAAEITVRYSDAPKDTEVEVTYMAEMKQVMKVCTAQDEEISLLRI